MVHALRSKNTARPDFWQFPDRSSILIICGELPEEDKPRYARSSNNNYMQLCAYADIDSMFELHGHICSLNPTSVVRHKLASDLKSDDLQSHLIIVGGVGLNIASRFASFQEEIPVRQVEATVPGDDVFELVTPPNRRFHATFNNGVLVEDVGLIARKPNPMNVSRSLTTCNGIFTRGVYGAVRCLTDAAVGHKNCDHLKSRFHSADNFGLLMRVQVFGPATPSPDLTNSANVLYEWPPTDVMSKDLTESPLARSQMTPGDARLAQIQNRRRGRSLK